MNSARLHTDQTNSDGETPQTFAAKLREIGYREPVLPTAITETPATIGALTCVVRNCGQIAQPGDSMCRDCSEETEAMARYLAARDRYLRELHARPSFVDRAVLWLAVLWHKIWGGVVLIVATTFLTIGLCASEGWTTAEVTAYCPCALCCGTHDRTTANNTNTDAVPYAFAADRSLPFGTRVYVPNGLGVLDQVRAADRWFVVDDRGGALDTEARRYGVLRLDLRVRDHWWAVRFGRRSLPVFITTN